MVMVRRTRQYLDTIEWDEATGTPTYDSDGNPIIPDPERKAITRCRYENFSKGGNRQQFRNRNGEVVLATGTLFVKYGEKLPEQHSIVTLKKVRGVNEIIVNAECLMVDPNQLNSTIHLYENVGN